MGARRMDGQDFMQAVVEFLVSLVDMLAELNPGLDPMLWAILIFIAFAMVAAFTRRLIGLLVSAVIIVAGVFVAWHILGW